MTKRFEEDLKAIRKWQKHRDLMRFEPSPKPKVTESLLHEYLNRVAIRRSEKLKRQFLLTVNFAKFFQGLGEVEFSEDGSIIEIHDSPLFSVNSARLMGEEELRDEVKRMALEHERVVPECRRHPKKLKKWLLLEKWKEEQEKKNLS